MTYVKVLIHFTIRSLLVNNIYLHQNNKLMSNVLMIYVSRTGWCALEFVDTEIRHLDS